MVDPEIPSCERIFQELAWQRNSPPQPAVEKAGIQFKGTAAHLREIVEKDLKACTPGEKARLFKEMNAYLCGPADVCQEFRREMVRPGTVYNDLARSWAHRDLALNTTKLIYGTGMALGLIGIIFGLGMKILKGIEPLSLASGIVLTTYSLVQYRRNLKQPRMDEFKALTSLFQNLPDRLGQNETKKRSPWPMIAAGSLMIPIGLLAAFLSHRRNYPLLSAAVPLLTVGAGCLSIGLVDWRSLLIGRSRS